MTPPVSAPKRWRVARLALQGLPAAAIGGAIAVNSRNEDAEPLLRIVAAGLLGGGAVGIGILAERLLDRIASEPPGSAVARRLTVLGIVLAAYGLVVLALVLMAVVM